MSTHTAGPPLRTGRTPPRGERADRSQAVWCRLPGLLLALAAALWVSGGPAAAAPLAPSIAPGGVYPAQWAESASASVVWVQERFEAWGLGPALVQVNLAPDGSALGAWDTRAVVPAPLSSGLQTAAVPVADLDGRHAVRVVVAGAAGSPADLGVLAIDRQPPAALAPSVIAVPDGGYVQAAWVQRDSGIGGDPSLPSLVLINTSPTGDGSGEWRPFSVQHPPAGDGPRLATTSGADLADGAHLVIAGSADQLGNAGASVLGFALIDRRPPVFSQPTLERAPGEADPSARIAYVVADPLPGLGIAPEAQAVASDAASGALYGSAPAGAPIELRLPGPGSYQVVVRLADRAGLVGAAPPVQVDVPAPAPPERIALLGPVSGGDPPGPGVVEAYRAAVRFSAARGVALSARLVVARRRAEWTRLLGAQAAAVAGMAPFTGEILIAPRPADWLESLRRVRLAHERCRGAACLRAPLPFWPELDRMVVGLAVLLHESVHASGPRALEDFRDTGSGRSLEEGLTEAATCDLLAAFVRSLGLPEPLEHALLQAAARYRPAYPAQLAWVRELSARAVGAGAASAAAARWRVRAADSWGPERWALLAGATGTSEAALRAAAPPLVTDTGSAAAAPAEETVPSRKRGRPQATRTPGVPAVVRPEPGRR